MHYDMVAVGRRIKKLRLERKLTQEQLAELLHISVSMMSQVERGVRGISMDALIVLTEEFPVSIDYIIKGKEISIDQVREKLNTLVAELVKL